MAKKKLAEKSQILQMPRDWQGDFRSNTMRTNFNLTLTQPMIQFLCAVADGVKWDRHVFAGNMHAPDNFLATSLALKKRGLIWTSKELSDAIHAEVVKDWSRSDEFTCWKLTPAGEHLVALFKSVGIFVEADAAIIKKARG